MAAWRADVRGGREETKLQRVLFSIDRISMYVGKTFAWFVLVLTLVTSYDILATKFFRAPTSWAYDVSVALYGTLFMMGGAYALSRNAHVRGDIFYSRWTPRRQATVDVLLYLLFFFPGIIALVSVGAQWAWYSFGIRELSSQSPIQTPVWPFKAVIPIASAFLLLQGIAEFIRCIIAIRTGAWPPRLGDVEETESRLAKETQF
jgi:TRAP-type mannitol/chloroaromatic compound transport system permease small subunit